MSTELKHTPGPWSWKILPLKSYHKVPEISICNADGQEFIRQSYDTYSDQATLSIGDAYLIAAAPEMLEAAELLLTNWPEGRDGMDFDQLPVGVKSMRAAIAKAKGEQP
jgi:hypothetical protein